MRQAQVAEYKDDASRALVRQVEAVTGGGVFMLMAMCGQTFEVTWRGCLAKGRLQCGMGWQPPATLMAFPIYRYDRPGD